MIALGYPHMILMFGRQISLADKSRRHPESTMPDVEFKTNSLYHGTWHLMIFCDIEKKPAICQDCPTYIYEAVFSLNAKI